MERLTTRIGIEPGRGPVGRFGDTVILIPRLRIGGQVFIFQSAGPRDGR